jgi:hypothetical protein
VFVALPTGAYLYEAAKNALTLVVATDVRRVTGYQDFVDEAPLDLVYVADQSRMRLVPGGQRHAYSSAAAGAICRTCTSMPRPTAWPQWSAPGSTARRSRKALGLTHDQQVLFSQTVG